MSIDKAILHGKEHRKPYYHSGRFDITCRPHGSCPYCISNRSHASYVRMQAADYQVKEVVR